MSDSGQGKNLLEDLEIIHQGLISERDDRNIKMIAASKIRQLLVSDNNLLIQEILKRNWIPQLLNWLSPDQELPLQIGALWALTNIAAGPPEHTHTLIKYGSIPILIELLTSENDEILEQSVWVLGNIAGEGSSSRDAVLSAGVCKPLVNCLTSHADSQPLLKIGAWAISNLCDGQPRKLGDISILSHLLGTLLLHTDPEVLSHTCWSLSHLCDGPPTYLRTLLQEVPNLCSRLVVLLSHRSWKIVKPALRTIGNIVCAEDEIDYTEMATEAGAVTSLCTLVTHSNRDIQKEACWTLSNIAAGTISQIQKVIDSGIMIHIVALARSKETDSEVKSEASWVVLNASSCGSDTQIEQLIQHGSVSVLNDMLSDPSMRLMALEGIERILAIGETKIHRNPRTDSLLHPNPFASLLSVEAIENLYSSTKTTSLGKRVTKLYKDHFIACTICHKSFHKNTTVLKVCEECRGPVCHDCNCSVYHLSYQEEVWGLIESMEEEAKKAQKKKKKQKPKTKSKKGNKVVQKSASDDDHKSPSPEEDASSNGKDIHLEITSFEINTQKNEGKQILQEKTSDSNLTSASRIKSAPALSSVTPAVTVASSEILNDESFIAVSRHKRKNDRERDKQEKERTERGKSLPISRKSAPSNPSIPAQPTLPPPPPPTTTTTTTAVTSSLPSTTSTLPKSRPPVLKTESTSSTPHENKSNLNISRYADAVLQSNSSSSYSSSSSISSSSLKVQIGHTLPTVAPVAEFPPLSSQPIKKGDKRASSSLSYSSSSSSANHYSTSYSSASSSDLFKSVPFPFQPSFEVTSHSSNSQPRPMSMTMMSTIPESFSHLRSPSSQDHSNSSNSQSNTYFHSLLHNQLHSHPSHVPHVSSMLSNTISHDSDPFSSSHLSLQSNSTLYSSNGLNGEGDIEDDDLHMMRAEMLLGDDDDDKDLLNISRETEDLVEFLQETGSIAALAEKLGFRK